MEGIDEISRTEVFSFIFQADASCAATVIWLFVYSNPMHKNIKIENDDKPLIREENNNFIKPPNNIIV